MLSCWNNCGFQKKRINGKRMAFKAYYAETVGSNITVTVLFVASII